MKTIIVCILLGAISAALLCALFFWVGGYDFDHRSPDVAFGFYISFMVTCGGGYCGWGLGTHINEIRFKTPRS